jgi:hypothetical protein
MSPTYPNPVQECVDYRSEPASPTAPLKWTEATDNELLEAVKKYNMNYWGAGARPLTHI